jgi:hypothetical protein
MPLTCEAEPKNPRDMTCTDGASALQEVVSDTNVKSLIANFLDSSIVPHPYIEYRHSYWLKPKEVASSSAMHFHMWKWSAPGSTPAGCTPLDPLMVTQIASCSDSWLQILQKISGSQT